MSIDWFTLIAQIFNLILLLFLLRKFLYLPVLKAVEARQILIREELKKAENALIKAEKAEKMCLAKAQKIEKEKQQIFAKVRQEAEKLSADLREEAENQYHHAKEEWKNRLQSEQKGFDVALQKLMAEHFNSFAEKVIQQMANTNLNEQIVEQFIIKIKNLTEQEKISLKNDFYEQKQIIIQTAMPLSLPLQKKIEDMLCHECKINREIKFVYEVNTEIIGGIILQSGEYMIQWNLKAYLEEFKQTTEKEVSRLINKGA